MSKQSKYSQEWRDRAVRMVFECEKDQPSHWAAIVKARIDLSPLPVEMPR